MESDEQLHMDQSLEEVMSLLSPEAKKALVSLSEAEQKQLFLSLQQDAIVKDEALEKAKQEELEKFDLLIEEWKKYIDEDKWQEWVNYELQFRGWMFSLIVTKRVVKLMEMLDSWASPEEIKNKMLNEWCWDGYNPVRSTVIRFSKHWKEFEEMSSKWLVAKVSFKDRVMAGIWDLYDKLFG